MNQVIFQVLELRYKGNTSSAQYDALRKLSDIGKKTSEKVEGFERLGDYTWLCRLDKGLPALSDLVCIADSVNLPYRITYLENELKWDYFDSDSLLSDREVN